MATLTFPKTLLEAVTYFSDNTRCVEYLTKTFWPNGVICKCGSQRVTLLKTRQLWQCKDCRKQFSIKVNTVFENSALPLTKWLPAVWLLTNAKNGISSCELSRSLGISQHSTWFMLHRIREALRNGSLAKLSGTVESDESWVGGKEANRHISQRGGKRQGRKDDKTLVHGLLERGGEVRAQVVENQKMRTLIPIIHANVEAGATLYTDALQSYKNLRTMYSHDFVDHGFEYVRGDVHTNTIENYWSLVKRMLKGTYIHTEPFHLDRYLDEQGFRYNTRKGNDQSRFELAISQVVGKRLTYKELTGASAE